MKKILITGGAGFIGFELAKNVSEDKQNDIVIIDDLSKQAAIMCSQAYAPGTASASQPYG